MKKTVSNSVLALVGVSILTLPILLPKIGFSQTANNAAKNPYEYVEPNPKAINPTFPDDPGPEPIAPEGQVRPLPKASPMSCGTYTWGKNEPKDLIDLGPCE